jgi:hypothetical protein
MAFTVSTCSLASNDTHVSAMAVFKGKFHIGMLNATNGGRGASYL